jgi:hypothetical protein
MAPENDKEHGERALVWNIDAKGKAILDEGVPWAEGILLFTTDPAPTDRELTLINERLRYWEQRIAEANGRAEQNAEI